MKIGILLIDDDDGDVNPYIVGSIQEDGGGFYQASPDFENLEDAVNWFRGRCDSCIVRSSASIHSGLHPEHFWLFGANNEELRAWPERT